MAVQPALVTAEELSALPDDGVRRELVRGVIHTMAPTGEEHGSLITLIAASLLLACRPSHRWRVLSGDVGFRLATDPDTVRAPDVALVPREDNEPGPVTGYRVGPPLIAVEVVSPNDRYTDVEEKVREWIRAGCPLVFVVNPRSQTAAEHRPGRDVRILALGDTLEANDILPGWRLPLAELFHER